jgi:hypothetical protein
MEKWGHFLRDFSVLVVCIASNQCKQGAADKTSEDDNRADTLACAGSGRQQVFPPKPALRAFFTPLPMTKCGIPGHFGNNFSFSIVWYSERASAVLVFGEYP